MNINRLYVAQIYVCTSSEVVDTCINNAFYFYIETEYKGKFCKNTIVYRSGSGCYIDLFSKERYKVGLEHVSKVGQMYINFHEGLKPLSDCYDVNFDKNNISRKGIVRTLSRNKLLNVKEDDK